MSEIQISKPELGETEATVSFTYRSDCVTRQRIVASLAAKGFDAAVERGLQP